MAVCDWIDQTLSTRTNSPATSPMVLVMQRLSIFDPAAHLAQQESWTKLSFSAIATQKEEIPIGQGQVHVRKAGDLLHEERYPREYLDTQRKKMGLRDFEAQIQQNPVADGGGQFDPSKILRYGKIPKHSDMRFVSIDAASGSSSGSYTVLLFARVSDGKLYITKVIRDRYDLPALYHLALRITREMDPDFLVIERTSNGIGLIEFLNRELKDTQYCRRFPCYIRAITPSKDKLFRMEKAMVTIEEGLVLLPEKADWLPTLETELRLFPAGRNDDQVDALSQAVDHFNWFRDQLWHSEYRQIRRH